MTTTTYSFEREAGSWRVLLLRLLRRNLPAGLYFFGVSFLFFPLQYILEIFLRLPQDGPELILRYAKADLYTPANIYTEFSMVLFYGLMLLVPAALALSQMSWLHSRRAVDLYHSLPVGRPALLLANGAAAFLTVAIPTVLDYLVILAAGAVRLGAKVNELDTFTLPVGQIFLDMAGWLVVALAVIAVVLLVSTQVGSLFENMAFAAELLCAPAAILLLTNAVCGQQLRGYDTAHLDIWAVAYSTPVSLMAGRWLMEDGEGGAAAWGNWMLLLWLALALLLLWAAARLYIRRPSELAETSGAREPLNTLGRLGVVYLGGLVFGEFFAYVTGLPSFTLSVLAGAALVAVFCQLVLNRGFRDMKRALPSMAALVAVVTLVAFTLESGGLGYVSRLPDPERVQSVTVGYRGAYDALARRVDASSQWTSSSEGRVRYWYDDRDTVTLRTPEAIRAVVELHRSMANTGVGYGLGLTLDYDGGMHRMYRMGMGEREYFQALEAVPEFRQAVNPLYTLREGEAVAVRLTDATGLYLSRTLEDPSEISRILEAARADADAFDFSTLSDGSARVVGYLGVTTAFTQAGNLAPVQEDCWRSFCLPIFASHRSTIAAARQLGLGEALEDHPELVQSLSFRCEGFNISMQRGMAFTEPPPAALSEQQAEEQGKDYTRYWDAITDPQLVTALLERGLGRSYLAETEDREDEMYFQFVVIGGGRKGATFQVLRQELPEAFRRRFPEYFADDSKVIGMTFHSEPYLHYTFYPYPAGGALRRPP